MDSFCRGCLSKHEPIDLVQYTEKNRRLFVYSTGLQVKRNDTFTFQLCKDCCTNMKVACNFKKNCRNSDKKLKNYLEAKETCDNLDFITFIKNNDDSIKFRLPMNIGNSTPANQKYRDDDNESTCTSIQNFMTDMLQSEEILDSEARIIKEVIEEEADILEDSLDSHWLQDDVSVDSDFRLDFSPFSTPQPDYNYSPKKIINKQNEETDVQNSEPITVNLENNIIDKVINVQNSEPITVNLENNIIDKVINVQNSEPITVNLENNIIDKVINKPAFNFIEKQLKNEINFDIPLKEDKKCVIDVNLENALRNDSAQKVLLDELLSTPPMTTNISGPPTPLIANILFGDKIDPDIGQTEIEEPVKKIKEIDQDIDVIDEFLNIGHKKDFKEIDDDIEFDNSLMDIDEVEDINKYLNKPEFKMPASVKGPTKTADNKDAVQMPSSPIESKCCVTNFYCKMCKRQFKNLLALKVHCTKYHKFKIEKPKTKRIRKEYICDYCGKLFKSSRCIGKHLENHQKPEKYECKKCFLTFSMEAKMKQHERTHTGDTIKNTKIKKYICSICGAAFSTCSNYKTHKRRHLNTFTISCEECGKGFYRTSELKIHMRKHTGEKPFECRFCSRSFARQDVLSRHMKQHTGERPFSCQICNAKFCKAYDLKFHQTNSKSCQKQAKITEDDAKNALEEILVTNAFVF